MRHSLAAVLFAAAALVPGCARAPAGDDCREQFAEQHVSMAEYGNPGSAAMPILTARWDSLEHAFERLGTNARGDDCDDLDRLTDTLQGVETMLVSADNFSMADQLARAEDGVDDARQRGDLDPVPADLEAELEALRVHAPPADAALSPSLAALDRVDPLDAEGVASALASITSVADADPDVDRCRQALEVLARYDVTDYQPPT
ncbi:MAG: hypothetical protein JWP31_42 [Aeromicrobium sp.]|nr:hypothetical protein [Aeromicrobium sp.]